MNLKILNQKKLHQLSALVVLAVILFTSACFPPAAAKKVSAFSDGVDTTMTNTVSAYETIETVYSRRNKERFANTYDPNKTDLTQLKFDRFIPEEDWKARKLVIDGLRQYADSLKAVVSDAQLQEFDGKTKALGQELLKFQPPAVKAHILKSSVITDSEIQIFTSSIKVIGDWFSDYKRKKAVRQTVSEMKSAVNDVCNIFTKEIGEYPLIKDTEALDSNQNSTLRKKLWRDYSDLIRLKNDFIRNNQNKLSALDDRTQKMELLQLIFEREQADKTLAAVVDALQAIPTAHNNIDKAFDDKDTTLSSQIAKIFEEADRIKNFYESLKKG